MIPKIIHQIWIGPKTIPKYCLDHMETWKRIHPDYQYMLWTNENLPELPPKAKAQFDRYGRMEKWAFQCDILRFYILNIYGGVYVDVDYECFKKIDPLLEKQMFFVLRGLNIHWVPNSIFGSEPNNPLLNYILDNLVDEPYHGPVFLGREIKRYLNLDIGKIVKCDAIQEACVNRSDILCVPGKYFFNRKEPEKYAFHQALQSWLPKNNGNKYAKQLLNSVK